ncbi:hypothetical protein CHARACLAT_022206 [Characodon lateralis]|uniref:Uncharacterized protein n=1 Tax=Characodon lateralis TaxID=208331 RepID=A0ABU7DT85_9TELE|nr:hypothetical protein [Characodon lateralis]
MPDIQRLRVDLSATSWKLPCSASPMKLSHPGSASAENTPLFLRLASPAFRQLHPPVKTYPPSNEPNYPAALTATLDSITPLKAWIISFHMVCPAQTTEVSLGYKPRKIMILIHFKNFNGLLNFSECGSEKFQKQ